MKVLVAVDTVTRVQILDNAVCISHKVNTLGKRCESSYYLSSY